MHVKCRNQTHSDHELGLSVSVQWILTSIRPTV